MTESGRWRTRPGVTRIHRTAAADCRVLLLDSRHDGLAARTEDAIVEDLARAGLDVELDAVSDPHSLQRVLDEHPQVLAQYDVVVAIAPIRADWRGSLKVLTEVLERISLEIPTLLVDHEPNGGERTEGDGRALEPDPGPELHVRTLRLPSGTDSTATARRIGAALHVLLGELGELEQHLAAPAAEAGPLPAATLRLRAHLGSAAVERLTRITTFARQAFDIGGAELNLLDGDSVVTVVSAGAPPGSLAADDSLCAIALRTTGMTVMTDTWLDPDACRRSPTHGPEALRFYAACPIRSSTGEPIGVLCIWDLAPRGRRDLEFTLLHDLALLAEGELIAA